MDYSYWGLNGAPFVGGLNLKGFFLSGIHEEALARLDYLVQHRQRIGLLIGPAGTGKSLLLEVFSAQLRRCGQPVVQISVAGAKRSELLWDLLEGLGRMPTPQSPSCLLWQQLFDRFREAWWVGQPVVILFDQMESVSKEGGETISRLLGCINRPEWTVTVVLAGRWEILSQLGRSLLDQVDLQMVVEPWELPDTQRYVQEALRRAGRSEPIFTAEAVQRLHELSRGIPRQINRLANLALLAGALEGLPQIGPELIEAVYAQLPPLETRLAKELCVR